jgi:L-lysine exporter family protein LysE/ArgO
MEIYFEGFLLQLSLILALGAQNIFVLESGIKKNSPLIVALTCSVCDLVLVLIGVLGAATIFVQVPLIKVIFGVLGTLFLLWYGVLKIIEFIMPTPITKSELSSSSTNTAKKVVLMSLGFSLLNPHVYLDTIVLIGGFAAKYPNFDQRLSFGLGAGSFSAIWFFGLAILSSVFSKVLYNDKAMRIINLLSGIILMVLFISLGIEVWGWIKG